MGQSNSQITVLPPAIMDMMGYKVKVIDLPDSQLAKDILRRTNKYLLRLHPDKLDLVGRHDSKIACQISFYDVRELNQIGRVITISLGRSSCFGPGRMILRCSKTLSSSLISSSFIGRARRLSNEVSTLSPQQQQQQRRHLSLQASPTGLIYRQQQLRQSRQLPQAPPSLANASSSRASYNSELSVSLADGAASSRSSPTSRNFNGTSNITNSTIIFPSTARTSFQEEFAEDGDGYLPMLPGSRRISEAGVAGTVASLSDAATAAAAVAAAALATPVTSSVQQLSDEYVLPVSADAATSFAPERQSQFDIYLSELDDSNYNSIANNHNTVSSSGTEQFQTATNTRSSVYENLPVSPATVSRSATTIGDGRYACIDWNQVMQDSLQYVDSSGSTVTTAATRAASSVSRATSVSTLSTVVNSTVDIEDATEALNYVFIDAARTQAIRDLLVDKAESRIGAGN